MKNDLVDFVGQIEMQYSSAGVERCLGDFLENYGFNSFNYVLVPKHSYSDIPAVSATNMPSDWIDYYTSHNYSADDWTVEYCFTHLLPVILDIEKLPEFVKYDPRKMRVMNECSEILSRGFCVPIRGDKLTGGMAVYSKLGNLDFYNIMRDQGEILQLSMMYSHFRICDIGSDSRGREIDLTDRERDVLLFKSQGLSVKAISEKMRIRPVTVNFHWRNVAVKLGVGSTKDILPIALSKGIVDF